MNNLYHLEDKEVETSFSFDDEVLKKALKNIYSKDFHPVTDIEENLFDAVWQTMNDATDKGFGTREPDDPDFDFYQEIKSNNAVFSAFKVHRAQNDMAALLLDANGDLKPFKQWLKDVAPIADHQVRHWLRTEYDTAVIRAHQAADWRQFQREKDILPNLKWMPSTSVNPGADHRVFWGTIRPVDDPFWSEHRPGDRWNCKCSLSSTDEPVTPVPGGESGDQPASGLENNPGKDACLFGKSHPYIKEAYKGAGKAVAKFLENKEGKPETDYKAIAERRKKILQEAETLKGSILTNPGFRQDIRVSKRTIKEWLNQPHEHYREKNEMLLDIAHILSKATYCGWRDYHKNNPMYTKSHIFETILSGDKTWIIVLEDINGGMMLYSISDNPKVLSGLKK